MGGGGPLFGWPANWLTDWLPDIANNPNAPRAVHPPSTSHCVSFMGYATRSFVSSAVAAAVVGASLMDHPVACILINFLHSVVIDEIVQYTDWCIVYIWWAGGGDVIDSTAQIWKSGIPSILRQIKFYHRENGSCCCRYTED